jgi:hypothetical protein
MAYKWPKGLCNGRGIPFEKLPNVYLEKTDSDGAVIASGTFATQAEVDAAWADGYHSPGKPETRDIAPESAEKAPQGMFKEGAYVDEDKEPETFDDLKPAGIDEEFTPEPESKPKTKKKGK